MKNSFKICFLVLAFGFLMTSCNEDQDYETIELADKIKIDSVNILNNSMTLLDVQTIKTYSSYASNCEGFYGYDYVYTSEFVRDVTAYKYKTDGNCNTGNYVGTNKINFSPQKTGTYTFRFWISDNTFITKTIDVQ